MSGLEILMAAGAGAGLIGSGVQAIGQVRAGQAANEAAKFEAAQLEAKADQEFAASQREAEEFRRRRDLTLSSLQARSAASGFSATDPTTLQIADDIAERGTIQSQLALHGGSLRQADLKTSAVGRRFEGKQALKGSKLAAIGTIMGGASDFSRFAVSASRGSRTTSSGGRYRYG